MNKPRRQSASRNNIEKIFYKNISLWRWPKNKNGNIDKGLTRLRGTNCSIANDRWSPSRTNGIVTAAPKEKYTGAVSRVPSPLRLWCKSFQVMTRVHPFLPLPSLYFPSRTLHIPVSPPSVCLLTPLVILYAASRVRCNILYLAWHCTTANDLFSTCTRARLTSHRCKKQFRNLKKIN